MEESVFVVIAAMRGSEQARILHVCDTVYMANKRAQDYNKRQPSASKWFAQVERHGLERADAAAS